MDLTVNSRIVIPDAELVERFSASGGPGGQHANKASTRVELTWDISTSAAVTESERRQLVAELGRTVRVVADDKRSQTRNRDIAQQRLAQRIREASSWPNPDAPPNPAAAPSAVDSTRSAATPTARSYGSAPVTTTEGWSGLTRTHPAGRAPSPTELRYATIRNACWETRSTTSVEGTGRPSRYPCTRSHP